MIQKQKGCFRQLVVVILIASAFSVHLDCLEDWRQAVLQLVFGIYFALLPRYRGDIDEIKSEWTRF